MDLETLPAYRTICSGEVNLITPIYFPNEANRTLELEVVHGPSYQTTCASCQAGVKYIKQAFEYLDGSTLIWNRNITEQTNDLVVVTIGDYRREMHIEDEKVVIMSFDPTLLNLVEWFARQFKGQLDISHASTITMVCEKEVVSRRLGVLTSPSKGTTIVETDTHGNLLHI